MLWVIGLGWGGLWGQAAVGRRVRVLTRCPSPPALLLAVRINSKGREVLYLAKGDSVKLGCPYVLEPEDNGPQGVGIEWIQITPERTGPENVVSVGSPRWHRPVGWGGDGGMEGRKDGEGWRRDGAGERDEEGWNRRDGMG